MSKKRAKPAAHDALFRAVAEYVKQSGGSVIVAGPITIQKWPDTKPGQFTVAIACLGKRPTLDVKELES